MLDDPAPVEGVLVDVLAQSRMSRFVEEWQFEGGQIDKLHIEATLVDCPGTEPGRELGPDATRAGAADHDGENGLRHDETLFVAARPVLGSPATFALGPAGGVRRCPARLPDARAVCSAGDELS